MNKTRILIYMIIWIFSSINFGLFGQDMLSNPSFEIIGEENNNFGGWNQIGMAGTTTEAYHGSMAAKVSGLDNGSVNVSCYWQRLDCEVGEQWEISGHVLNTSDSPLAGNCIAMVNVEWRDINDMLIDYDSFTVADASTPLDVYIAFNLLSTPAPTGTVATHLLFGVLQNQNDPSPDVYYDQITYYSTTYPTIYDMQWDDFPCGRTVDFSDQLWRVKGSGWYGPGPNNFSHLPESIWIDEEDRLHLTIKHIGNDWLSTEVTLVDTLGYGDYIFTITGALDQLNIHSVLGLFLWQYGPAWDPNQAWWNPYNEIDVEFSYWNNPQNEIGQFVAQPWDWDGNMSRFDVAFGTEEFTSHAFNWLHDRVEFRSWYGDSEDEIPENMIHEWIYTGPHIPRPEQPRVHMNLWQFGGPPSTNQEVIVSEFKFIPANGNTEFNEEVIKIDSFDLQNYPNPFNPTTTLSYNLNTQSNVLIEVFNIKGQRVKQLFNNQLSTGQHLVTWNGEDDYGKTVSSGIYFYKLKAGSFEQTKKMILMK